MTLRAIDCETAGGSIERSFMTACFVNLSFASVARKKDLMIRKRRSDRKRFRQRCSDSALQHLECTIGEKCISSHPNSMMICRSSDLSGRLRLGQERY